MTLLLTPACSLQGPELLVLSALGRSCSGLTSLQGVGKVRVLMSEGLCAAGMEEEPGRCDGVDAAHGDRAQHARAGPARAAGVQRGLLLCGPGHVPAAQCARQADSQGAPSWGSTGLWEGCATMNSAGCCFLSDGWQQDRHCHLI